MMGEFAHIKVFRWIGLLLSVACLVCFGYGMHKSYLAMLPKEVSIRYADLEPLPRGLSGIEKVLERIQVQQDSLLTVSKGDTLPTLAKGRELIVAYRYDGHTLYDVVRGNDSLTIPAHITDTLPPVYAAPPKEVTEWRDSLLLGTMPLECYALDYRRIIARYDGQVSRIEWNSFDTIPIYIISLEGHDEPIYINATTPYVKPFYLNEEEVVSGVKNFCQVDSVSSELMADYDDYYVDLYRNLTLPVWKVTAGRHTLYVNPRTGAYQSFNSESTWLYLKNHALEALRYKVFAKHPEIWEVLKWAVLIIGALLSLTGVLKLTRKLMINEQ